jgi:hypothetical protein
MLTSVSLLSAQTLDWDEDIIAYGLSSSEHHPVITATNGMLQVSCDTGDGWIVTRYSSNNGLTWDAIHQIKPSGFGTSLSSCTDGDNTYLSLFVPSSDELWIYRFSSTQQIADSHMIPMGNAHEQPSICLTTDHYFAQDEPFLNLVWQEYYWGSGRTQEMFSQSRNRAQSFSEPEIIFEVTNDSPLRSNITTAVTWVGESERTWVGATVDRLGSIGERVVLKSKSGTGSEWQSIEIDSSAYTQVELSIAGHQSVLLAAYSRRINAASQKEIFFAYSLDNGGEFSDVVQLTSGNADDFASKIVVCPELGRFAVFYLSADVQQEPATLWQCQGLLATPWLISEPVRVSEIDQAVRSGGYDACATADGFAAVWTGPGILGDTEIWFDASWQGESVQKEMNLPVTFTLGLPYPNPFNSSITVPLELNREEDILLTVHNSLGREVMKKSFGRLPSGSHRLPLDFSALPSGTYYVKMENFPEQVKAIKFIK